MRWHNYLSKKEQREKAWLGKKNNKYFLHKKEETHRKGIFLRLKACARAQKSD